MCHYCWHGKFYSIFVFVSRNWAYSALNCTNAPLIRVDYMGTCRGIIVSSVQLCYPNKKVISPIPSIIINLKEIRMEERERERAREKIECMLNNNKKSK